MTELETKQLARACGGNFAAPVGLPMGGPFSLVGGILHASEQA